MGQKASTQPSKFASNMVEVRKVAKRQPKVSASAIPAAPVGDVYRIGTVPMQAA